MIPSVSSSYCFLRTLLGAPAELTLHDVYAATHQHMDLLDAESSTCVSPMSEVKCGCPLERTWRALSARFVPWVSVHPGARVLWGLSFFQSTRQDRTCTTRCEKPSKYDAWMHIQYNGVVSGKMMPKVRTSTSNSSLLSFLRKDRRSVNSSSIVRGSSSSLKTGILDNSTSCTRFTMMCHRMAKDLH